MEDESRALADDGESWPPAPTQGQALNTPVAPVKEPSRAEIAGRKSLRCCVIATAGSFLLALSWAVHEQFPPNNFQRFLETLSFIFQAGSICLFVVGFVYSLFGLRSWEGKVGLFLALTSPIWIWIDFLTLVISDPPP